MCRRSRRRGITDSLLSLTGLRPWRCRTCERRFHAWAVPAQFLFYTHCPACGNMDLHTVTGDRVAGVWLAPLYRLLRFPAYRCEDCRNRFFSSRKFRRILPAHRESRLDAGAQLAADVPAIVHTNEVNWRRN